MNNETSGFWDCLSDAKGGWHPLSAVRLWYSVAIDRAAKDVEVKVRIDQAPEEPPRHVFVRSVAIFDKTTGRISIPEAIPVVPHACLLGVFDFDEGATPQTLYVQCRALVMTTLNVQKEDVLIATAAMTIVFRIYHDAGEDCTEWMLTELDRLKKSVAT